MSDAVLRHYWHPVATADELGDGPLGVSLLDERIVVWRSRGTVVAFRDLCIHRGTPLSLGRIEDGNLVCAYHGWAYAPEGACVRIPSLEPGSSIPRKARATDVYRVAERYGLVWLCLAEPRAALPELPELEDPTYRTFLHCAETWDTSAARMIENFIDTSHFPFVHTGINATPEDARIPDFPVRCRGDELHFETRFAAPTLAQFRGPAVLAASGAYTEGRRQYRVVLPFTAQAIRPMPEGRRQLASVVAAPLSARRMRYYAFSSRNFALDHPDDEWRKMTQLIFDQDRVIVERQRPEELPLDLSEELHLKGPDAGTLQYRRMLAQIGLSGPEL
jgi:phenylpropionate dioxygenase-like ring-hydroxylating dioxygenase large terminal subunit